jgi:hypothetical protein
MLLFVVRICSEKRERVVEGIKLERFRKGISHFQFRNACINNIYRRIESNLRYTSYCAILRTIRNLNCCSRKATVSLALPRARWWSKEWYTWNGWCWYERLAHARHQCAVENSSTLYTNLFANAVCVGYDGLHLDLSSFLNLYRLLNMKRANRR